MVTASIVMSLCSVSTRADAGSATTRPALPTPKAPYVVRPMAEPFSLFDARLLDGPFKESQDAHARYMLGLDPDRLAARFRVEAGLPAKAECYPGWENIELPGVGAGFYLSGCSRLYAATGDARFLERVNHLLDELEECQKANGNGFLLATKDGKRIFAEIERGDIRFAGGWMLNGQPEPYYAMEKLFAGLRDAWRVAGASKGLSIAVNLANYLEGQMSHLNDEQMQRIMSCEFGGMNWLLADLYADTGDPALPRPVRDAGITRRSSIRSHAARISSPASMPIPSSPRSADWPLASRSPGRRPTGSRRSSSGIASPTITATSPATTASASTSARPTSSISGWRPTRPRPATRGT